MSDTVTMEWNDVKKCLAIIRFGPETSVSGMRPAEYFQVTVDPNMVSPSGVHIRFGMYKGDEIVGWQRIAAMTICEVLQETPEATPMNNDGYNKDRETVPFPCVINTKD